MVQTKFLNIAYISPTYFDSSSTLGGGERYPTVLAARMSEFAKTTLISFGLERKSYYQDSLKIEIYPVKWFIHNNKLNPVNLRYLKAILGADIIHIHQVNTLISDLAAIAGFLLKKRVFVTDHGGGGSFVLNQKLPVFDSYDYAIAQSQFALNSLPIKLQQKAVIIKGGVDTERFCPDPDLQRQNKILFVGRILPHKGIHYLIKAFRLLQRHDYKLTIIGKIHGQEFYMDLQQLAKGLAVEFIHDADDDRLLWEYRTAQVTVLPSTHELMGLTLLESQACGTPVICSEAEAMPEFVESGRTGFIVKPQSEAAIATALRHLINLSSAEQFLYQQRCQDWIYNFSWSTVVKKHLDLYQVALNLK